MIEIHYHVQIWDRDFLAWCTWLTCSIANVSTPTPSVAGYKTNHESAMSGELGSKVVSWELSHIAIECPRDFETPFTYQGTLKGCPKKSHVYDSIPGVHLVLVYVLWDGTESLACPTECCVPSHPMVHWDRTDTWDWGIGHGTLWDIPSYPITSHGLIGIAATVPGTFGIPNVPMDIC